MERGERGERGYTKGKERGRERNNSIDDRGQMYRTKPGTGLLLCGVAAAEWHDMDLASLSCTGDSFNKPSRLLIVFAKQSII